MKRFIFLMLACLLVFATQTFADDLPQDQQTELNVVNPEFSADSVEAVAAAPQLEAPILYNIGDELNLFAPDCQGINDRQNLQAPLPAVRERCFMDGQGQKIKKSSLLPSLHPHTVPYFFT